jgi:redox-sensitive bicupin YhaK (pirin superfamily)
VSDPTRRDALKWIGAAGATAAAGCQLERSPSRRAASAIDPITAVLPLGQQWPVRDPFLFCVHHDDRYPAGNERLGPAASLAGRELGSDFVGLDGWRMYHGDVVPGFPAHPHRGFETVTIVRRGLLDHSDSLGAAARYGGGDVQWLTAGRGIQHAEMFPLLRPDADNPVELFQIWLNLPAASKMVDPHFSMLWNDQIPRHLARDDRGRTTEIAVIAGALGDVAPPPSPPKSWAAAPEHGVAMWTIKMAPDARWSLPAAAADLNRSLFLFSGELAAADRAIAPDHRIDLASDADVALVAGRTETELLLLQGRPIAEAVVQQGPFVMNTRAEIQQAFADYRATRFGGWPWPSSDPVHAHEPRFARHADGRLERPA